MHIENGRIYDMSLRKSVPLGTTRLTTAQESEAIARQTEAFLRNGGRITEVAGFAPKQRRPHYPGTSTKVEQLPGTEVIRGKGRKPTSWPEAVYLKDKLFAAELTYLQLAEVAGVPRTTLASWFSKGMIPSEAWKLRVAEALQRLLAKHRKA